MSEPLTDEELEFYAAREHVQASRVSEMARELRAHRAWRAKLGEPDTWFPGLFENDVPGETTSKARKEVLSLLLAPFRFSKLQMEAIDGFAEGIFEAADELQKQARALVERAKEGI